MKLCLTEIFRGCQVLYLFEYYIVFTELAEQQNDEIKTGGSFTHKRSRHSLKLPKSKEDENSESSFENIHNVKLSFSKHSQMTFANLAEFLSQVYTEDYSDDCEDQEHRGML
jgi:hypothetical protein